LVEGPDGSESKGKGDDKEKSKDNKKKSSSQETMQVIPDKVQDQETNDDEKEAEDN